MSGRAPAGAKKPSSRPPPCSDALDGAVLAVSGETLIDIRHLDTIFTRESDGETTRATLKFRAVMEEE